MSLYKRGETWMLEFYHEGTRYREKIGRGISPSTAADLAVVRKSAILKGEAGIGKKDLSIDKCIDLYLEHIKTRIGLNLGKKSRRPATLRGYQECAKNLLEAFSGKKVSQVSGSRLRTWRAKKSGTPYAFNRALNFLSAVVNHAIEKKRYNGANPAKGVERFEEDKRKRVLSAKEFRELILAACSHLIPILMIAVYQGIRVKSQILTLRKSDVDLVNGVLHVRAANSKNKKDLVLPMRPELIEVYREQMKVSQCDTEGEDWLFVHPKNPKQRLRSIKTALKRARERAGIAPFRTHDLRHTFATWLVEAGVPLTTIMELGGWAKLEMLEIYVNPSQEHKLEALNRVPWIGASKSTVDILRDEEIVSRVPMKEILREKENGSKNPPTYPPTPGIDKIPAVVND